MSSEQRSPYRSWDEQHSWTLTEEENPNSLTCRNCGTGLPSQIADCCSLACVEAIDGPGKPDDLNTLRRRGMS